jgi:hypothetical protein
MNSGIVLGMNQRGEITGEQILQGFVIVSNPRLADGAGRISSHETRRGSEACRDSARRRSLYHSALDLERVVCTNPVIAPRTYRFSRSRTSFTSSRP